MVAEETRNIEARSQYNLTSTRPSLTNYGHYLRATKCNNLSLPRGASGMMKRSREQ